ncbi:MAG TPA: helix-turn-helix domain-containing protein [Candidatus Eisenbergiella merdavium]|uniref:Helix-turn-helix domain-containing protein n=1 Tax=Candidatus Eisenbergiella merdavium TaxID=2838551 RepID=A0A9D2NCS0_9FIRM|nr:helix-turn-helix domain-containing protein [Candidatus Eisenbergiella merdavium]
MQKKREKLFYDRSAAGTRLKKWRLRYGWTRREVAERCGLTEKYYSDIERGSCGMSVETLISLSKLYGFTMDYLIYGEKGEVNSDKKRLLLSGLSRLSPEKQDYCLQMLFLFMERITVEEEKQ